MASVDPPGPPAFSIDDLPGPAFLLGGADGRVIDHSAAFAAWAGRPDLTGLGLADLFPGDPGAVRMWQEARSAGAASYYVERRGLAGESSFWCLHARSTPAGVLVYAGDLTPVATAAHAVHAAEQEYVAVAAHELRAPLSAIKAWASALDGRRGAEHYASDGLEAIARQVDRMNELLTDLLDAARAGSGVLRPTLAEVTVDALVRGAVAASPHAADVRLPPVLAGAAVVDAVQIEAVLGRVLGWVAARRTSGSIRVAAERGPHEVHVVVSDPGPALSRHADGELFARSLRHGRGRGLGLYLCQQLAAASGARLFHESGRFVLALPREAPPPPCGEPGHAHVLVGEANAVERERALAALRLEGHEAAGAADGESLRRILSEHPFDVVVADLSMPDAGGLAALRHIQALPAPPAVIVIAPSAERPEALDGAERAGALAVLPSPVDWPHLLSLIGCAAAARTG